MRIIPYIKEAHDHYVAKWQYLRELPISVGEDLPAFGLIVFEGNEAIAAGFLRQMEGNFVLFDSYITNPRSEPSHRNAALNRLTSKLLKIAEHNKVSRAIMFSTDYNTLERAISHDFQVFSHVFCMKNLTSENLSRE